MFNKELLINAPKTENKNSFLCTIEVVRGNVSGGLAMGTRGYGASNDSLYPFGSVTVDSDYPPVCYMFFTGVNENNGTLSDSEQASYGTVLSFYDEMEGQDYEFGEQITVRRLDNGNTMTFIIDDSYTYNNEGDFFTLDDVGSTIQFEVIYD